MPFVQSPLAANFRGLNRIVAPNLLDPSESPDTTDARSYGRKVGELGPRLGRARVSNRNYALRGMGVLNTPTEIYRVLPDSNGIWYSDGTNRVIVSVTINSNVVTVVTQLAHGLLVGDSVSVELDSADSDYSSVSVAEGVYVITTTASATTFAYVKVTGNVTTKTIGGFAYFAGMEDQKTRFLQYGLNLYCFNGRNRMRVFDGIGFTPCGIVKASYTPTVANAGGSGPTGTYRYFVVPTNKTRRNLEGRGVEGIPSTVSAAITVTDDSITVGGIPASHADLQVTGWNVYRNKTGTYDTDVNDEEQDFFYVGYVAIGATSMTDTSTDATLTSAERQRFNQNYPPTCKFGAIYGDRMFVAGFDPITTGTATVNADTTLIDFSGVTLPDGMAGCYFRRNDDHTIYVISSRVSTTQIKLTEAYVGALSGASYTIFRYPFEINFSEFGDMEGWGRDGEVYRNKLWVPGHQAVTGLMPYGGMLLVFTADAIFAIQGKGPNRDDVHVIPDPLYRGIGCLCHDTIVPVDNELHFLSWRGPARIAGSGAPELTGLVLNTDWLDRLTVAMAAVACAGTDDEDIYFSVPDVSGTATTYNGKTFRYERATQSWWEETETHPYLFVRGDATNNRVNVLYYLQGKYLCQPKSGTTDLLTGTNSGTVGAGSTTTTFDGFFTGDLVECYVRFFSAGIYVASRRIITNTSSRITWSSDATLPGSGELTLSSLYTYEINNVWWKWKTKSLEAPGHRKIDGDLYATLNAKDNNYTIGKTDFIDGVERQTKPEFATANQLVSKRAVVKANNEYAVRVESRNGAVLRSLTVTEDVQEDTV